MTCFSVFFESPIVIGPWSEKPGGEHGGSGDGSDFSASGDKVVGEIHGGFHAEHGDKAHSESGFEGDFECHAVFEQYAGFEDDAGQESVKHGERKDHGGSPHVVDVLEDQDGADVAECASGETPCGVVCAPSPGVRASPEVSGFAFFSDFGGGHEFSSLNFVKCLRGIICLCGRFSISGSVFRQFCGFFIIFMGFHFGAMFGVVGSGHCMPRRLFAGLPTKNPRIWRVFF